MNVFEQFVAGNIFIGGENKKAKALAWQKHPVFEGVFLKNLLAKEKTNGLFSPHLVQTDPEKAIGLHVHEDSLELH